MRDRKTYSLNSLSDWIRDSVTSEATPEEIHAVIISSIQNEKDIIEALIIYQELCCKSIRPSRLQQESCLVLQSRDRT